MRKIIAYLLMLITLASTSACSKEMKEESDVDSSKLVGNVEIWTYGVSEGLIETYTGKFKLEQNKITINNLYLNKSEFNSKLTEAFNSGKNMPDIMVVNEEVINDVKANENKFTIIPWYITLRAMFYRRDIFEEAKIKVEDIKTWNDYIEVGKRILEHTGGKVKLLPLNVSNDSSFYSQLLYQQGGSYYNKEGRVQLSSEHSIKAMTVFKRLYDSNVIYRTSDKEEVINAARRNEIASIPYGTELIGDMRDSLKEQSGLWGIMNMPAFEPGGMNGSTDNSVYICINKEASHNKAVGELKAFLQNNKVIEKDLIVNKGIFPAASQLFEEPFMDEEDAYFGNQKIWRYLVAIIKDSPEFNVLTGISELKKEIIKAQEAIIYHNQDARSVLGSIDKQAAESKLKN
jgi:lactose/L-arabinose transport system substrate-binding protein